jgi:hypothetical protein
MILYDIKLIARANGENTPLPGYFCFRYDDF